VLVHWRATVGAETPVRRLMLGFDAQDARGIRCDGKSITSTVARVGRRTRIAIAFSPAESSEERASRALNLSYAFRASDLRNGRDCYRLDASALPRILDTSPRGPGQTRAFGPDMQSSRATTCDLELTWNPAIQCFGPARTPTSGHQVLSVTRPEWDDLEIQFGKFQRGFQGAQVGIWFPQSEAGRWSHNDLGLIDTWFGKVWTLLTEAFATPPCPVTHVLLTGEEGTVSQYLSNSNAIWISYQRSPGAPWPEWAIVWLAMKLLHELSHAWWVPASIPYTDRRAWSLAEAVATVCEYTMIWTLFDERVLTEVWTQRANQRAVYLRKAFSRHQKLYGVAESGLRAGYALSAVSHDYGSVLTALRHLLDTMRSPQTEPFEQSLTRVFGADLGQFLLEILAEPQPPLASVRMQRESTVGPVATIRFGTRRTAQQFARWVSLSRLGRAELKSISWKGRRVVLTFLPTADPRLLLGRLSPGFLVYRRTVQEASSTLLATNALRRAEQVAEIGPPTSLGQRIHRLGLGILAIAVFSDSPVGYNVLADAFDGRMPLVATRAREAALSRSAL